ncbi:MAG: T9SS type A sorting domain-containing protein [Cytophagaceae bacterium]|jgi:hypothetical protein|nr:T9SS type A sorting domain-containing protein [Cytophagaceae bacterium]
MKKILLALSLFVAQFAWSQTVTTYCPDFTSTISKYQPTATDLNYSVNNGELTLTFTNYAFWGTEVKVDFPSVVDLSGQTTTGIISYTVDASNIVVNGTGDCSAANYISLGVSLYDDQTRYSGGTASEGYYTTDQSGANNLVTGGNGFTAVTTKGISFKAASAGYANCTASNISGTVVIRNLKIGTGNCVANIFGAQKSSTSTITLAPNPASDEVAVSLSLDTPSDVKIVVSDLMGKEMTSVEYASVSELSKSINVSNLSEGVYQVSHFVNGVVAGTKMLVVK